MKRKEVFCAVIGGVVGAVLVMAAGTIAPLGAQNEAADAEFGTITCSKLVVRYDGSPYSTEIDKDGVLVSGGDGRIAALRPGGVFVFGEKGKGRAYVTVDEYGGYVRVRGKDGGGAAGMAINENGGAVTVSGKDGGGMGMAGMLINEYGGAVTVSGKDGGVADMSINENGGVVTVRGKDRGGFAKMATNEYGGSVHVFGEGSKTSRATIAVNEYGNGGVSTWDKNGYRLANLK